MIKKKLIYFIFFIVVIIGVFIIVKLISGRLPYNLTKPEHKSLEIEGKKFSFIIQKYNPPFMFKELLQNEDEMDSMAPEGVCLGMQSATNKKWFLSLLDRNLQEEYLNPNKKLLDAVFKNDKRNIINLDKQNFKFLYKITVKINEKEYAIIYGRPTSEGKEYAPGTMTFVKEDDGWKQTTSLKSLLKDLVGKNDYEGFKKLCE